MKNKIFLTLLLSVFALHLFACSCIYQPMGINKIMRSEAIVGGKIIKKSVVSFDGTKDVEVSKEAEAMSLGNFKYTLEIQERVKGIGKESIIHFYSNMQSAACGVNYDVGAELYVFLHYSNDRWSTSSCSGNISKEYASDIENKIIKEYKTAKGKQEWFNEYKKLEAVGKVKNQTARGKWTFYFSDGTVAAEGKYKKGLKKGKWKIYKKPANQPEYDQEVNPNKEKVEAILKSTIYYKKGKKIKTEIADKKETE